MRNITPLYWRNAIFLMFLTLGSSSVYAAALPAPCMVPLQLVNSGTPQSPLYRLGINVGLGGDVPRLYEFDTGGQGFWAANKNNQGAGGGGWGSNTTLLQTGTLSNTYASGNVYTANLVGTTVTLYAPNSTTPACGSSTQLNVAQITNFNNTPTDVTNWNNALATGNAPLFGNFYGDFGAALYPILTNDKSAGVYSILPQLVPAGLINGFIVHVGALGQNTQPTLQIGLTNADIQSFQTQVSMNPFCASQQPCTSLQSTFPQSGVSTYSGQQINATVSWQQQSPSLVSQSYPEVGLILDTGAPITTVFQGSTVTVSQNVLSNPNQVRGLWTGQFNSAVNMLFTASKAPNVQWALTTGNVSSVNQVLATVAAATGATGSINTGLAFYTQYDVMFNLQSGMVGLRPLNSQQPINCFFNWAETAYTGLLSPAGGVTQSSPPYTFRYYANTNAYLGVSSVDNNVYYMDPNGILQNVGPFSGWLATSGCSS